MIFWTEGCLRSLITSRFNTYYMATEMEWHFWLQLSERHLNRTQHTNHPFPKPNIHDFAIEVLFPRYFLQFLLMWLLFPGLEQKDNRFLLHHHHSLVNHERCLQLLPSLARHKTAGWTSLRQHVSTQMITGCLVLRQSSLARAFP